MEEERKGLLTSQQEEFLANVLDYWFKFGNKILENWDKVVFKYIIRAADNMGADKIPDIWKDSLIPIIDAAIAGKKEDVRLLVVDFANAKIDIPKLDDEQELLVFDSFSKFIATAIDFYIQRKVNNN